jgi:hypothetical protein
MKDLSNPDCLIIDGDYFLGFPLCQFLLRKGCRVAWVSQLTPREKKALESFSGQISFGEKIPKDLSLFQYLFFFFNNNQKKLEAITKAIKNKSIKLLVVVEEETPKVNFSRYQNIDLRVVRLSDVYGPGMDLNKKDHLSRLFNQAINGGPLTIPGEGWEKIAPLYVDDLIEGIGQAIFSHGTEGKIFDFTGEEAISLISFAYLLQKNSSLRPEIEYVVDDYDEKEKSEEEWDFLGLKTKVSLEEGIKRTLDWFAKEKPWLVETKEKESSFAPLTGGATEDKEKDEEEIRFQPKLSLPSKKWLAIVSLWLFLLFSPLLFYGLQAYLSFFNLQRLKNDYLQGDLTNLVAHAQGASRSLVVVQRGLEWVGQGASLIGLGNRVEDLNRAVFLAEETAEGIYYLGQVGQKSGSLFVDFIGGKQIDPQVFPQIQLELDTALTKLSPEEIKQIETLFPEVSRSLAQAKEMSLLLPKILFVQEKKTYLVLFQNNMELRPSGGFIGSFGLLTVEGGKLLDFEIHDVYFADGQLKGHVEPPVELKRFLGEAGWYLRDSNWSPDFPTSARRAEWFLDKEIGRKVDGVFAVDLSVMERILEATGDLYLSDYDETINASNFFERAEYHSEAGFFPGSTQKQDYLGKVAAALFEELKTAELKDLTKLGFAVLTSLEGKDILIYLDDEEINNLMTKFNWDGGIKGANCRQEIEDCFKDYLYLNEANVGINKANYFINREIEQAVVIDTEGKVKSRLVINYQNNSPSDVFPAGDYRNYLRLLLPLGSEINQVVIKDPAAKEAEKKIEEFDRQTDFQRESFGFLVEVPVGERRRVVIEYQSRKEEKVEPGGYLLLVQKQSGTKNDQYNLSISYPPNLSLTETSPEALTREGLVVYNTNLSRDMAFELVFK